MIFLGFLLVSLLFAASVLILGGGPDLSSRMFPVFFDPVSLFFVLSGIVVFIFIFGRKEFIPGMKTFFAFSFPPNEDSVKTGQFFLRLTKFTVRWGLFMMFLGFVWLMTDLDPNAMGPAVAVILLSIFYASGLALFLFLPIGLRLSPAATRSDFWKLAANLTLSALAIFVMVRFMAVFSFNPLAPVDEYLSIRTFDFRLILLFIDFTSFVLVLGGWWAFRLAVGRKIRATLAVSVILLIGIFWSIQSFVFFLADLDPNKIGPTVVVCMLTTLYSLIAAAGFLIADMRRVLSGDYGVPSSPALSSEEMEQAKEIIDRVVEAQKR